MTEKNKTKLTMCLKDLQMINYTNKSYLKLKLLNFLGRIKFLLETLSDLENLRVLALDI